MTRARARALETEVASLLSDISYDPLETWLLPKSGILCMIRYQEDPPKNVHADGQDPKSTEEESQRNKERTATTHRTSGHVPGHPARGDLPGQENAAEATGPEHPASSPDIRTSSPEIRPPDGHPEAPFREHRRWPEGVLD